MQALLEKVFEPANLKPQYLQLLLSRQDLYTKAFTSASFDPINNYEVLEHLGDSIAGAFLSWYFYRRFPQLNCKSGVKVIVRLKNNYACKEVFAGIADKLGFWPLINASPEEKQTNKKSLLENVFEAFIGATVEILDEEFMVGVGMNVMYDVLKSIYDKLPISLEWDILYDSKTKLKEMFDVRAFKLGKLEYEDDQRNRTTTLVRIAENGKRIVLSSAVGNKQADRHQAAAAKAIALLEKEGYVRKVDYSLFCE